VKKVYLVLTDDGYYKLLLRFLPSFTSFPMQAVSRLDLNLLEIFTAAPLVHAMHFMAHKMDSQITPAFGPERHLVSTVMLEMELAIVLMVMIGEVYAATAVNSDELAVVCLELHHIVMEMFDSEDGIVMGRVVRIHSITFGSEPFTVDPKLYSSPYLIVHVATSRWGELVGHGTGGLYWYALLHKSRAGLRESLL